MDHKDKKKTGEKNAIKNTIKTQKNMLIRPLAICIVNIQY